jgi:3-dehydroquinate synthase
MTTVQVLLADRSYPIRIRAGSLADLGEALAKEVSIDWVITVTTPRVGAAHYGAVATGLARMHLRADRLEVPDGERAKTLRHASRLYDQLLELGADRSTAIVGLGGGACCDLAGFVASTYLRGVPLVQVPTTLLAQVDASVGGKTGVNHSRGKNLIGSFYQPKLVWVDPDVLATLPGRELRSGMAEIVKVAVLWDAEFFAWLEEHVDAVMRLDREALTEAISRGVGIKAEIVGLDEREAGLRALLNFGHTFGHALEAVNGYRRIRHGEAVSIGMVFAARVSEHAGLIPSEATARLRALLERIGLPTEPPRWDDQRDAYLRALAVDKKVRGEKVGFVVLRELGRAEQLHLSPDEILAGAP